MQVRYFVLHLLVKEEFLCQRLLVRGLHVLTVLANGDLFVLNVSLGVEQNLVPSVKINKRVR